MALFVVHFISFQRSVHTRICQRYHWNGYHREFSPDRIYIGSVHQFSAPLASLLPLQSQMPTKTLVLVCAENVICLSVHKVTAFHRKKTDFSCYVSLLLYGPETFSVIKALKQIIALVRVWLIEFFQQPRSSFSGWVPICWNKCSSIFIWALYAVLLQQAHGKAEQTSHTIAQFHYVKAGWMFCACCDSQILGQRQELPQLLYGVAICLDGGSPNTEVLSSSELFWDSLNHPEENNNKMARSN